MAVIVGIFSFNGIEVIAVTSGEAQNPQVAIPAALAHHGVPAVLLLLPGADHHRHVVPWTATGVEGRRAEPVRQRVRRTPVSQHAAGIMNFVVISAALSSMNTNVYLCSRMLFSLSRGRYAPQVLGRLSNERQPGRGHPDLRARAFWSRPASR